MCGINKYATVYFMHILWGTGVVLNYTYHSSSMKVFDSEATPFEEVLIPLPIKTKAENWTKQCPKGSSQMLIIPTQKQSNYLFMALCGKLII